MAITPDRLAEIRQRAERHHLPVGERLSDQSPDPEPGIVELDMLVGEDVPALLAEVDRLRALIYPTPDQMTEMERDARPEPTSTPFTRAEAVDQAARLGNHVWRLSAVVKHRDGLLVVRDEAVAALREELAAVREALAEVVTERDLLRETLAETDLGQIVQAQWEAIADADTKRDLLESERDVAVAEWNTYQQANTRMQQLNVRRTDERDKARAERDRLGERSAELLRRTTRWKQQCADHGDYYNRTGAQYEYGKAVVYDALADEVREVLGEIRERDGLPDWDDGTCGDCADGRCHGGEGPCGCARHEASQALDGDDREGGADG